MRESSLDFLVHAMASIGLCMPIDSAVGEVERWKRIPLQSHCLAASRPNPAS